MTVASVSGVLSSGVVVVGDRSISVSVLNQDSGIESLEHFTDVQHTTTVTTCGILIMFMLFLFVSLLHLVLSPLNVFSAMIWDLDKV